MENFSFLTTSTTDSTTLSICILSCLVDLQEGVRTGPETEPLTASPSASFFWLALILDVDSKDKINPILENAPSYLGVRNYTLKVGYSSNCAGKESFKAALPISKQFDRGHNIWKNV